MLKLALIFLETMYLQQEIFNNEYALIVSVLTGRGNVVDQKLKCRQIK